MQRRYNTRTSILPQPLHVKCTFCRCARHHDSEVNGLGVRGHRGFLERLTERGMRVARARDVLRGSTILHRQNTLHAQAWCLHCTHAGHASPKRTSAISSPALGPMMWIPRILSVVASAKNFTRPPESPFARARLRNKRKTNIKPTEQQESTPYTPVCLEWERSLLVLDASSLELLLSPGRQVKKLDLGMPFNSLREGTHLPTDATSGCV